MSDLNIDKLADVKAVKAAQVTLLQFMQLARSLDGSLRDQFLQTAYENGNEVVVNFKKLQDELEDFLNVS